MIYKKKTGFLKKIRFFMLKTLYFFTVIKYHISIKFNYEGNMEKKDLDNHINSLYEILLKLETKEDCAALLSDLCTYKEVEQMAQRAYAAKLFLEGKTYTQITEATELSSATLSRISRCITHGSGGYAKFIKPDKEQDV